MSATSDKSLTQETEFNFTPATDRNMMAVRGGEDVRFAVGEAECLEDAVRKLLGQAVDNGEGMDSSIAWLCHFSLDAANALRESAGQSA